MITVLKKTYKLWKENKLVISLLLILGFLTQIAALFEPLLSSLLIQKIQFQYKIQSTLLLLLALTIVGLFFSVSQQIIISRICETELKQIRLSLLSVYLNIPVLREERFPSGWYSSRIVNDTSIIRNGLSQTIICLQNIVLMIGAAYALVSIDLNLFLISLVFISISVFISKTVAIPLKKIQLSIQEMIMKITIDIQESSHMYRVLRAYNATHLFQKKITDDINSVYKQGYKLSILNSLSSPIVALLLQLTNLGTLVFGIYQVASRNFDLASLAAYLMYFNYFSTSVSQILNSYIQIKLSESGEIRVSELLSEPTESFNDTPNGNSNSTFPRVSPAISFHHVSFAYPQTNSPTLTELTFRVPAGKRTAIVGPSGCGKTTCLGLVARFYSPQFGDIYIGNTNLSDISSSELRDNICYIDQTNSILTGTVRDNLVFGDYFDDQYLIQILREVDLYDELAHFNTNPLDYFVGQSGTFLSGGQKQRLSLARAILRKPKILIMDEPTSSVDGFSEIRICNLLQSKLSDSTILYSAHRVSTISIADWIVVIEKGHLVVEGTHAELMKRSPYYRAIINQQLNIK